MFVITVMSGALHGSALLDQSVAFGHEEDGDWVVVPSTKPSTQKLSVQKILATRTVKFNSSSRHSSSDEEECAGLIFSLRDETVPVVVAENSEEEVNVPLSDKAVDSATQTLPQEEPTEVVKKIKPLAVVKSASLGNLVRVKSDLKLSQKELRDILPDKSKAKAQKQKQEPTVWEAVCAVWQEVCDWAEDLTEPIVDPLFDPELPEVKEKTD